jgi:hypothetical protein
VRIPAPDVRQGLRAQRRRTAPQSEEALRRQRMTGSSWPNPDLHERQLFGGKPGGNGRTRMIGGMSSTRPSRYSIKARTARSRSTLVPNAGESLERRETCSFLTVRVSSWHSFHVSQETVREACVSRSDYRAALRHSQGATGCASAHRPRCAVRASSCSAYRRRSMT